MVPSHGETACTVRKNMHCNNKKLKCIYNQSSKTIECLGETEGKGKKNALPGPSPNHLQSSWPVVPLCLPTIFLWSWQWILFMSTCEFPDT